jgi:hypothetical protein
MRQPGGSSDPTAAVTTSPSAAPTGPPADEQLEAARIFSLSILVSGVRCLLTYVVFPWVLPLLGLASGVGPVVGVLVGVVAIAANVASIRRVRSSTHPWRRPLMLLNSGVIALLVVLVVVDLGELVS